MRTATWFSLGVAVLCAPAFAQESEIVVTAERRGQSVLTLAGNAARLDGEALARIGAQHPAEALNRLPGVGVHRNNGVDSLPAIRSPVLTGGQSAGSFLLLEDGVPIRAAGFSNVNALFETSLDLADAVEVVRGPGSALYGSNAVHGIVNVITPALGEGEGARASLEAGDFGRVRGTALSGHENVLIGASALHSDGWRDAASLDQQSALVGAAFGLGAWRVDARLALQNLNQQSAGFIIGENAYEDRALARTNPTPGAHRDQKLARARATFSREIGADWRVALTPYARAIDAQIQLFFLPSRAREETRQSGAGLQAAAYWDPHDRLSMIFGIDLDRTDASLREEQFLPDQPNGYVQGLHYDYDVTMETAALYAQARWRFAADWSLTAGLRGEQARYDYDNNAPDGDVGRFRRAADRTDEFSAVTPKLGLVWTPHENGAFWLNLARGARPPQITDLYSLQTNQTAGGQNEETIDSVELGWRGVLGPVRGEIAFYHMDKEDTSFRNADGFTVTDGATRHQGVEISASAPINARLTLSGWATYARHTYRFDDPSSRDGETIRSGADVDTAPRTIANISAAYVFTPRLEGEIEWAHMGEYYTNAENTRTYPGHDVFNARLDWRAREGLVLFAAMRNVLDEDYADRADFAFGDERYFPGEGRAVTVGVRVTGF